MQVHYILAELCVGGMVAETNMVDILTHYTEQEKIEKQEVGVGWGGGQCSGETAVGSSSVVVIRSRGAAVVVVVCGSCLGDSAEKLCLSLLSLLLTLSFVAPRRCKTCSESLSWEALLLRQTWLRFLYDMRSRKS